MGPLLKYYRAIGVPPRDSAPINCVLVKQTSTATTSAKSWPSPRRTENHNGLSPTNPLANGEVPELRKCLWGLFDPGQLVNERGSFGLRASHVHVENAGCRLDAADSRYEGSQLGQEAMRALQGRSYCLEGRMSIARHGHTHAMAFATS